MTTTTDTTINFAPLLALREQAEAITAELAAVAPVIARGKALSAEVDQILVEIDQRIRASLGADTSSPSTLNDLNEIVYAMPWVSELYNAVNDDR